MKQRSLSVQYVLLFVLIVLFIQGCAHMKSTGRSRGKLSGATKQATNDSDEARKRRQAVKRRNDSLRAVHPYRVPYNRFHRHRPGCECTFIRTNEPDSGITSGFDLSIRQGLLQNKDFYGVSGMSVAWWRHHTKKRIRIDIHGSILSAPVQQTSSLSESLDGGVLLLKLQTDVNVYTTPSHTFIGQYFIFGIGYTYMQWHYANEVVVPSETGTGEDLINNDALDGLELYTGVGLHLMQTRILNLGVELTPGVIFWLGQTAEGFDNDVFRPFWYTRLDFKLGIPLSRQ